MPSDSKLKLPIDDTQSLRLRFGHFFGADHGELIQALVQSIAYRLYPQEPEQWESIDDFWMDMHVVNTLFDDLELALKIMIQDAEQLQLSVKHFRRAVQAAADQKILD